MIKNSVFEERKKENKEKENKEKEKKEKEKKERERKETTVRRGGTVKNDFCFSRFQVSFCVCVCILCFSLFFFFQIFEFFLHLAVVSNPMAYSKTHNSCSN